nr:PREDICTED: fatty acid synthase-like [Linepithema humile]
MSVQYEDDDIVITGISGRLPESSNIEEFKENLMKGMDMVSEDDRRWSADMYNDVSNRFGKIKDIESFDASFFEILDYQARVTDPQLRMLLEVTFEAIVDAGINPITIKGSRTGVFVGVSSSEACEFWTETPDRVNGFGLLGCCRSMLANRISFAFGFIGPSYALDAACSSSLFALHQAVASIRAEECDAAIVAGLNLILQPLYSLHLKYLNVLSKDGKCKVFDSAADGYVRAEAVVAIYLQKLKDARRVYATIVHTKTNTDGYKLGNIAAPNGVMQKKLLDEIYSEAGIDFADVAYIEAHGTGTKVGDVEEIKSIDEMFCQNRKTPLLIGSVKSNMGHAEAASGLCSVIKVLIAMETGVIPANLHFNTPNPKIPALSEGRLKVVDKHKQWNGGLVGINAFGFGGNNVHVILRSNPKSKLSPVLDVLELPALLVVSGRTEEAVNVLLDNAKQHKNDNEFISLLRAVYSNDIPGHTVRGYEILSCDNTRELFEMENMKRPIWFIFPGMGSQWPGMGRELLRMKTFRCSMKRCADALKPHGIDLMNIIINGTKETYENVIYSSVSIVAIQIALVDVLTSIGIQPNGLIGHSFGELCCAYCDDEEFTLEQTVLAAYYRSKTIADSKLEPGAMAVVGLSWEEAKETCPSDITPACHNSKDLITISGRVESVQTFVEELKSKNIFAKIINSSGVAFHSKYIASIKSQLLASFNKVITKPNQRSSKWISSSIPKDAWDCPLARLNSSDYHVNNMLSPVLFQEAIAHIPNNAITIEIAPHRLLRAILCKSLPPTATNISLQKRNHSDNSAFLLSEIGKLYIAGAQPNISKLYSPVNFPVARGTPMVGHLIRWYHYIKWDVPIYKQISKKLEKCIEIDLSKKNYNSTGHRINGEIIYPQTTCLFLVWEIFASLQNKEFYQLPVTFEHIRFQQVIFMSKKKSIKLTINIAKDTFEIWEDNLDMRRYIANGYIYANRYAYPMKDEDPTCLPNPFADNSSFMLSHADIYKELSLRGHEYSSDFRNIESCDSHAIIGKLYWFHDYIPFINNIVQFSMLSGSRKPQYISYIQQILIDPDQHKQILKITKQFPRKRNDCLIPVLPIYRNEHIIKSGGIEIKGLKTSTPWWQKPQANLKYEQYAFVPYEHEFDTNKVANRYKDTLTIMCQIVCENVTTFNIKIVEVAGERAEESLLAPLVFNILRDEPLITFDMQVAVSSGTYTKTNLSLMNIDIVVRDANNTPPAKNAHLVIAANVLSNQSHIVLNNLINALNPEGFILLEETAKQRQLLDISHYANIVLVAKHIDPLEKTYILLKKREERKEPLTIHITQYDTNDIKYWLEELKFKLKMCKKHQEVLLICQGEEIGGFIGLAKCIRKEYHSVKTRYVFDQCNFHYDISDMFYEEQLDKGLIINVYKNESWGSYRHLRLDTVRIMTVAEHAYVGTVVKDNLRKLEWIESPLKYHKPDQLSDNKFLCMVYYAAINKKDVSLENGKMSPQDVLLADVVETAVRDDRTLEFSGRDMVQHDRYMGITGALATTVLADSSFLWKVPDKWTLEEAATIPIAYVTSYYALFVRGELKPGESILIHNGVDHISQAAIIIALYAGCTIFTTVHTQAQRQYIKDVFPNLTDKFIGDIQNSFEQLIVTETQGRGVDVVLNSLPKEKLQATIRCLSNGGRFLDLVDNEDNAFLSAPMKNITFHFVNRCIDLLHKNCAEKEKVVKLVQEGIDDNVVCPLPRVVFSKYDLEKAFSYQTDESDLFGKVLLKIQNEEPTREDVLLPRERTRAMRRIYMDPNKSYVLVGGLGGFGLELADWLITRGAKYIVLVSRSGIRTIYQTWYVQRWIENGVKIVISTKDVTTASGATSMIEESWQLAPIGGIFNLAAVLRDKAVMNLKESDFKAVMSPKIDITRNLDMVPDHYYSQLDYFVAFSSMTAGRGNAGQCNYGFANAAMERLIEKRSALNKPGLVIQWCAVADVGLIIDNKGNNDTIIAGTVPQRMWSCLKTLEYFLQIQPSCPVLSSVIIAEKRKSANNKEVGLVETVIAILGIRDVVNPDECLNTLGMDSVTEIEVKQVLENYNIVLSVLEIRALTISKLHDLALQYSSSNQEDRITKLRQEIAAHYSKLRLLPDLHIS